MDRTTNHEDEDMTDEDMTDEEAYVESLYEEHLSRMLEVLENLEWRKKRTREYRNGLPTEDGTA